MSLIGRVARSLGTALVTGSPAGAVTAFATNSLGLGVGTGIIDNLTYGGVTQAWSGNYGYGGMYDPSYGGGMFNQYDNFNVNSPYQPGMGYWGW